MSDTASFNEKELQLLKDLNKEAMVMVQHQQILQNRTN